jgi:GrpB-like predicted nucleotidyltransferase (UPF0157 family)/predicted acetyltransferase
LTGLRFERPSAEFAQSFAAMRDAFVAMGDDPWTSQDQAIAHQDPVAYAEALRNWSQGRNLPPNRTPFDAFWILMGDVVVGQCGVRHPLTPKLEAMGGNVGYDVHPGYRNQGVATFALREALKFLASKGVPEALITCAHDNAASIRVIEKCGGRRIEDTTRRRYVIPTGLESIGPAVIAVHLSEPNPAWAETFGRERLRLIDALGPILVDVHHIGSTAIPGIRAKPVIDALPVVLGLKELDAARGRVESLGYDWWGEYGIEGRRFCTMQSTDGLRILHAHFFERDAPAIERHLAFRDYLRDHPTTAREYEAVKVRSAAANPDNSNDYNESKSPWIRAKEAIALDYYRGVRKTAGHKDPSV